MAYVSNRRASVLGADKPEQTKNNVAAAKTINNSYVSERRKKGIG